MVVDRGAIIGPVNDVGHNRRWEKTSSGTIPGKSQDTEDSEGWIPDQKNFIESAEGKVNTEARNYKCPHCGGEFNFWDEDECPFCGLERKGYND